MNCPKCGYEGVSREARFCPQCGASVEIATRVDIRLDVGRNLGRVVGVQTQAIHGDVYGGDIYEVQVYALSDAGREASWRRFLDENTPPYKFLFPYTAQDRTLFKGREREVEQIVRQIGEQRLLVVYGQAEVGKTSLLRAGVVPDLIQNGALVIHIQDYIQPVRAIRAALAASIDQIPIPLPDEPTLPALVRAVYETTQGSLVLILDQFERAFDPPVDDEQRTALFDGLSQALQAVEPAFLRLVVVVREEALGRLGELQDRLPDLLRSPVQLLPLSHQQAQAAIEAPLDELGWPVSPAGDLVEKQLVPDLDELTPEMAGWIQPPHLQIVCHWLYQAARDRKPPHITAELYADEGKGADGIMARYMEETLQTRLADKRGLAEHVLKTMVSPEIGRWVSPENLPPDGASSEQVSDVLKRLVKEGLLVQHAADGRAEYTFASHSVAQGALRLAGREVGQRYEAENELERIWSAWLARDVLAARGQLRYLAEAGAHLMPRAAKALLLLRSAVARDESAAPWLNRLRTDEGRALIRELEDPDAPDPTRPSSRSVLAKAALLLGLRDESPPDHHGSGRRPFGPVAWSAVVHPDSATRRTAALALTVPDRYAALDRLDWALQSSALSGSRRRQRKRRLAELRGALADADPEIEKLNADLPSMDRLRIWLWRARRRIFRDRQRVAWLTLGGAIGAGLGLGLLRAALGALAQRLVGIQFAMYFYWAAILGAGLSFGMAVAESLLLYRLEKASDPPPVWRMPLHPDRLPDVLSFGLGAVSFGIAHMIVALFNGLSLIEAPLVAPMGFAAGLGLSAALYAQPRTGWRQGFGRWLLRLGVAALAFVLAQEVFIAAKDKGPGIAIAWAGSFYKAEFTRYTSVLWPNLAEQYPRWFDVLALLDAALVGIALTLGTTAGLAIAARWLARWRALMDRVNE